VRVVIDGREMKADDETDEILGALDAIRARRESKEKSHRQRGASRLKAERGRFHGGPTPLGYRLQEEGGLVIDPAEAAVVRRIFEETVAGRSQRQVARDFERDAIPTKRGGNWSQPIVRRILNNPTYRGVRVDTEGREYPGEQEAIVSDDLWRRAQDLRDALARTKGGGRGQAPLGRHLFRHGLLRCGRCGEAMVPRSIRPRSKTGKWGEWYLCYRRVRLGPDGCSRTPVAREPVDSAVLDFFQHVALDVEEIKQELAEASDRALAEARAALEQEERDLIKTQQAVQRIRTYVHEGRLTPEELDLVKADERASIAQVEQLRKREQEAEASPLTDAQQELVAYLMKLRAVIAGRVQDADSLQAVRAALVSFFEALVVHDSHTDTRLGTKVEGLFIEPVVREGAILQTLPVPVQTSGNSAFTM
jgi:DNA invertase Pin-like site-specific DNA recombinase